MRTDRYPVLPECPWCGRTDIPRVNKGQKTCGSDACKAKQMNLRRNIVRARKGRK